MPALSLPVGAVLTIVAIIFTAGITWGVTTNRQKASSIHIEAVIQELKAVVSKLQDMATDIQVSKAISARFERSLEAHEGRIRELETQVAKLTS